MIWQFDCHYSEPRYWIIEKDLRDIFIQKRLKRIGLKKEPPFQIKNDYETYRIVIRKIASNTNERTLISSVIPKGSFVGNSLSVNFPFFNTQTNSNSNKYTFKDLLIITSLLNSLMLDYSLRLIMTTNINLFFLYQLRMPRLTDLDPQFMPIVSRAARLICTTPEFDELAREVGLGSHKNGVTDPAERAKLRSELDGLVAHLYGVTREEFQHILSTFPIVAQEVRDAALCAYDDVAKGKIK